MKAYLTILLIFYLSGAAGSAEIAAKTFMEISLKPLQSGGKALVCCGTVSAGKVTRLSIWSPPADCSALKICEAWSGLTAITLHMNSKVKFAGFVDAIKGFQELRELVITDSRDANPINWAKVGEIVTLKSLVLVPGEHAKTWLADLAAQQTLGMLNTLTINYSTTSDLILDTFDYCSIKWFKNLIFICNENASIEKVKALATSLSKKNGVFSVKLISKGNLLPVQESPITVFKGIINGGEDIVFTDTVKQGPGSARESIKLSFSKESKVTIEEFGYGLDIYVCAFTINSDGDLAITNQRKKPYNWPTLVISREGDRLTLSRKDGLRSFKEHGNFWPEIVDRVFPLEGTATPRKPFD